VSEKPPPLRSIEPWPDPATVGCSHGWTKRCGAPSPYKLVVIVTAHLRIPRHVFARRLELPRCAVHARSAARRHGLEMPG
jgi:hypothetical protein